MGFIWSIIIGIVAGYLAGKIMRGGGFGVIVNLILGIIGGVLGGWVFSLLGISAGGILGSLITSTVGAILLLWIGSQIQRGLRRRAQLSNHILHGNKISRNFSYGII
jgi:uncharacterized membrane protein YeaQ/YmgE (transglycosylase-associated protein family)